MLIGYARVSTNDQDTSLQEVALRQAGCERIYTEKASGGRWDRPELHRALEQLRPGDVLLVWKLDRLSRSLKDLLQIIERIGPTRQKQAGFDRPVFIHNIIARGTVDELVIERVNSKREVQDILLDAMRRRKEK